MKTIPFYNVILNTDYYQEFFTGTKLGTSFAITGKIKTDNKNKIETIELIYDGLFGIINFEINDIVDISWDNDPDIEKKVIFIDIQLRALSKFEGVSKVFNNSFYDKPLEKEQIIHFRITDEILNIDVQDDISPCLSNHGFGGHCRSKVII